MNKQKIHFVGIGGIGISALARYFLVKDYQVSGSDLSGSEITEDLNQGHIEGILGITYKQLESSLDKAKKGSGTIDDYINSGVSRIILGTAAFKDPELLKNACDKYLHLEMLAVEPKLQGMGYAKKLLEPMFEQLDSENLPCFLETSTEKNVPFYQYFGFEVVEESTIPGSEVPFWDMLRKPFSR